MSTSVTCHILNNTFIQKFEPGQHVSIVNNKLITNYNISSSSKIICCLQPRSDTYSLIITQIPINKVPQHLYFYTVSESEFFKLFQTVTVSDDSDDFPTIEFILNRNDTLKELEGIFIQTRGYATGTDIAFSDATNDKFEECPLDWKISLFGGGQIKLNAKRKLVIVTFDYNRTFAGRLEVKISNFSQTARQIFEKKKKDLEFKITNDLSKMAIWFEYKGTTYQPNDVITPQYQANVKIKIKDDSNRTMLFEEAIQQNHKLQKINHQNMSPEEQMKNESKISHQEQAKPSKQYSKNIQKMLLFKQIKKLLRDALKIADENEQNRRIKDIIALNLRAFMNS